MALERYRQKRDFRTTPEPAGKLAKRRSRQLAFVVQKHAASRLHYDFRLELNGVLLSWAVPKGPSLDPNDKRLAMHVEDHPLEYGEFEGVIPPRQYGAGTVMVWDRGTWTPTADPDEGYAKGRLKFEVHGEKLKGGFNLVRSRSGNYGGDKRWLLFKEADDFARLGPAALVTEDRPHSVVSGRSLEQIAADGDGVWHSNRSSSASMERGAVRRRAAAAKPLAEPATLEGAQRGAQPERLEPQLATLMKAPPSGPGWVHEIKHDGYRMLCRIADGSARMVSRTARDWTDDFRGLAGTLARLPVESAWLDGEVVAIDAQGRSSFQALQNALSGSRTTPLTYIAFDLLYLDGVDLRGVALAERKRLLKALLSDAPASVKFSDDFAAPGAAFLQNVQALGLEGMISKRADRPYRAGRGPAWVKVKCARRQDLVIGGYTDPEGAREGFGALLLGVHEPDGRLRYSGKVGTGFDAATLASLGRLLAGRRRKESPFHDPPRGAEARRAHWVEPTLVAEVSFTEWTDEGTLRHPSFQRLRADRPAGEVVREGENAGEKLDTLREPRVGVASRTKLRATSDPNAVAGVALTHPDKLLYPKARLTKRDLAQYCTAVGEWMLPQVRGRPLSLVRCPNGWDKTCFPWEALKQATLVVRTLLDNLGLASFLKTTGGKGLHVVVPIEPSVGWEDAKGFTKAVAELLERTFPDRFTSKLLKVSRGGRIFIDYLRNAEGATAVAAYSLRAKANAPVSTPIGWDELAKDVRFAYFNARNVPRRLARLRSDPWKTIDSQAVPLTTALMAKVGYRPR